MYADQKKIHSVAFIVLILSEQERERQSLRNRVSEVKQSLDLTVAVIPLKAVNSALCITEAIEANIIL